MALDAFIEKAKPYAVGAAVGIVGTLIVEFSAGWVVTSGTMQEAVETAKVEQLAAVCADRAVASWTSQNNDMSGLEGWENWEEREKLATTVSAGLPKLDGIKAEVIDECADMIMS